MGRTDSPLAGKLVFLVGAQRSGTNWLQRILASHPRVAAVPSETHLFSHGIAPLSERIHHAAADLTRTGAVYMDRDEFLDASREFCDRVFAGLLRRIGSDDSERLIERTPWHAKHLELITAVYPDARIIHIVRDGRDVARSLTAQPYGPGTVGAAAAEWRESVESAQRMRGAPGYIEVRYESLLADTRGEVANVLGFLGVEVSPAMLDSMLAEAEVRFNVDPSAPSVGAGKWRTWSRGELRQFDAAAGELNRSLGYSDEQAPRRALALAERLPRARGAAARIGRRLLRLDRSNDGRRAVSRMAASQRAIERVLEAAARGETVAGLCTDTVVVRSVRPGTEWSDRGRGAVGRLAEELRSDSAFSGTQIRGEVHVAVPTSTAYLTFALAGGEMEHRVLAVQAGPSGSVERITLYEPGARK